jgi:hypothetical protein
MSAETKTTTDHKEIKKWAEERGGWPAKVKGIEDNNGGILRIDFPGFSGEETLETISWNEFFQIFDENNLKFLYQEKLTTGEESRFFKFVGR